VEILSRLRGLLPGKAQSLGLDNLTERVEGIASALMNLEINTIVKAGMSGQKMPPIPLALHLIAGTYAHLLLSRLPPDWRDLVEPDHRNLYSNATGSNGPDTFAALGQAALDILDAIRAADAEQQEEAGKQEWFALLVRVKSNSLQIAHDLRILLPAIKPFNDKLIGGTYDEVTAAVEGLKAPLPIPPDFTILVRKAWDLGDETVVFQTSLQIDGDIIARVSPSVFDPVGPACLQSDAERLFVSGVHNASLAVATAQWKTMFELLGSLARGLAGTIFSRV
jgi:hypothetical protein